MSYTVGHLGWKVAARMHVPMTFHVRVRKDEESGTFWASSDHLDGLAVSGDTLDEVYSNVVEAANALLDAEFNGCPAKAQAQVLFSAELPCAA